MDTIGWIVAGLAAGWVTGKLMLNAVDRLAPGAVVGMVGAFLGGTATRLLDHGAQAGRVTPLVAALGGAIGLTFVLSVFAFGRATTSAAPAETNARRDEGAPVPIREPVGQPLVP